MSPPDDRPKPLQAPGPLWWRRTLAALAAIFLGAVFLGSAGSSLPREMLPAPVLYYTQVACLFPRAATHTIEYRLSAFSCEQGQFLELDYRPYFPLHPDDKENRFHRLGHFYRRHLQVMRTLEDHIVERHNQQTPGGAVPPDGLAGPIGGILVSSLRIPLPEVGERLDRYTPVRATDVPPEWRRAWYRTPLARAQERCEDLR